MIYTEDCAVYCKPKYALVLGRVGIIAKFVSRLEAVKFVNKNFKVELCYNGEGLTCYHGENIVLALSEIK